jgi:molybdopterin synthase catalytic subunit
VGRAKTSTRNALQRNTNSDTALRALSIHERGQLMPEEVMSIASIDSAQRRVAFDRQPAFY